MVWYENNSKMIRQSLTYFLVLFITLTIKAQQPEIHEPELYVNSDGQVFTRADAPAYLFISPTDSPGELILTPSSDQAANPMQWDGHGSHYIVHRDLKRNMNIRFRILADGIPPRSSLQFEKGIVFHLDNNYFAEVGSSAFFSASDAMSGVKTVFVSIDSSPFKPFTEPLVFNKEGEFDVKVYAIDNVGNAESPKEFKVFTSNDALIRMDNIYFDINSSRLRPEAIAELDKLVVLLKKFSNISLEIRAHTDSRGEPKYNLSLSEERAKAAVAYLTSKGINSARLSSKGFGETMLLNECSKGVQCPEDKHRFNRRVEFLVSKIKK